MAIVGPAVAFGVGGPAPGAVSAQTVKLPSGPGSVRGLADDASVSSFTGAVQYAVPIELPAGPAGVAPSLALEYDGSLGNGPVGVGWQVSQAGISRSLRLGVPSYDASDELDVAGLGGGGQLVAIGGGEYRLEGSGNAFAGQAVDGGFELTGPEGTTYRFGTSAAGRKASGTRVSAWYLEQVRDVAGQTIDYRYAQDGGEVYLDSIEWGPTLGGVRALRAEIVREARADAVVSYRTGFRVESARRIAAIRVWSSGGLRRTVTLSYDDSFPLTRLRAVRVTGGDGVDSLPPLTFRYAAASVGAPVAIPGVEGWGLNQQGTSLFDVDDDGAMDLLRLTTAGHSVRRNVGGQFGPAVAVPGAVGASLDRVRLLDLTGDSGAEMVWQQGSQWRVFQLAGSAGAASWVALGSWAGATNVSLAAVSVADLDGDYRMDVMAAAGSRVQIRMGTAEGLAAAFLAPAIDPARSFIQPGNAATSFPDVNGDGLADVVYLATNAMYRYLGRGDGTFEKLADLPYPWTGAVDASQVRLGDLDRDGLLDVAVVRAGNVDWYRGLAAGAAAAPVTFARPGGTDGSVVVALADANGNGSEDLVWSSDAGMWIVDFAGPTSAGMLTAIENGMGQTQRFAYEASAQLAFAAASAGAPWSTSMPISIPVTARGRLQLASGEPDRSSRLDVRDPVYDRVERRFVGFLEAAVSRPDPADGAPPAEIVRRVQRFAPGLGVDRAMRGQVLSERVEDGTGAVFLETTNQVAAVPVAGLSATDGRLRRAVVTASETIDRQGVATPIVTRTEIDFDGEGRPVEERALGRLDVAGDEGTVRRRYTDGRSARGVRDAVCEEWTYGPGEGPAVEVLVSHAQTLYGDAAAVAPLCDAAAGWSRVTRQYLASEDRWVELSTSSYDAAGNPVRATQGGVTRDLEYDAQSLHPRAETVHPSATRALRWEMTWEPVQAQPTLVTGPDGASARATYDGLGRVIALARSGAAAHVHHRYHVDGPRPYTESFTFDGPADAVPALPATWAPGGRWRHAVAVMDSAGESLFTATRLDTDRWLVAGRRQRDARGRTIALADAYEWQGTLAGLVASPLPAGIPARSLTYDALDRVIAQTLPGGAQSVHAYRAFESTTTTEGMAPVTTTLDGRGRVLRTERTVDGVTEAVEASYDGAGRITSMRLPGAVPVEHRFEYDTLGRLVFATDPDIGDRAMAYDDGGRLVASTNGASQTVRYAYDGAGRLASIIADDGSAFTYHYDDALDPTTFQHTASRLAWIEEPTGRVEIGYDDAGQEARGRRSVDGLVADRVTTHAASGLILTTGDGDGLELALAYDPAGRLTAVGDLWTIESQDPSGRSLRERFGNGVVQTYQRDLLGQASHIRIERPGGAALYDVDVDHDPAGSIVSVDDLDGVGLDHTASFTYDGAARLTAASLGTGAAAFQFAYRYDGLQNMVRREARGPVALGALVGDYVHGGSGAGPRQLSSVIPDPAAGSPPGAPSTAFVYDAAGRLVQQGALGLTYNGFDQLTAVTGVTGPGGISGTVGHAYGYDGLRVKTVDPAGQARIWFDRDTSEGANGVRQHDVRIGDRLIARITRSPAAVDDAAVAGGARIARGIAGAAALLGILLVLAAAGLPWTPRPARRRTAASAVAGVGLILASCGTTGPKTDVSAARTTTQVLYYHKGIGAGPTVVSRVDGSVHDERRYEPFGAPLDSYQELPTGGATGPVDFDRDPHNILDKETDASTGWSDHGARWMAPETARWLTPDPPVKAPDPSFMTSPWSLHPYQYVEQNPVLYWDPDGQEPARRPVVDHYARAMAKAGRRGVLARWWTPDDHTLVGSLADEIGKVRRQFHAYTDFAEWRREFHRDAKSYDDVLTGALKTIAELKSGLKQLDAMNNRFHIFEREDAPVTREKFLKVIANEPVFEKALLAHSELVDAEVQGELAITPLKDALNERFNRTLDRYDILYEAFNTYDRRVVPTRGDYNAVMNELEGISSQLDALMATERSLRDQYHPNSCPVP